MRVLIACEESQEVCKAFRARGHEAYSCDIQPCSGGHPEWHLQVDALEMLKLRWDLVIAHPPCTYLTNAGARWLYAGGRLNEDRYRMGLAGKEFFMRFLNADCERIAVENPIPSRVYELPQYTQVIQPYEYGHPYSKKTCLWLKNLPMLHPTSIVIDHKPYVSSGSYSKAHDPKYKGASRAGGSAISRSKTFPGIARAMAEQWGCIHD
jgi:hypothetical protein